MRSCTAALVLATALIARVAAGPVKHLHAHFHEKKDAELQVEADVEKRDGVDYSTIDYSKVDYAGVDWATVKYIMSATTTVAAPVVPAPTPSSTSASAAAATTTASSGSSAGSSPGSSPGAASGSSSSSSYTGEVLTSSDLQKLKGLSFSGAGTNAVSSAGGSVWIGSDGLYTVNFVNGAAESLILIIWGPDGSWVNTKTPLITHSLPAGASITISFANGQSGAWSTIYSDTILVNGQVSNTWGEYTFSPEGVVDVSREPNMSGRSMSIVGPHCTSDMERCVFACASGNSCMTGYELLNCAAGSQPGAQYGTYGGAASGGCGWLGDSSAKLTATFS